MISCAHYLHSIISKWSNMYIICQVLYRVASIKKRERWCCCQCKQFLHLERKCIWPNLNFGWMLSVIIFHTWNTKMTITKESLLCHCQETEKNSQNKGIVSDLHNIFLVQQLYVHQVTNTANNIIKIRYIGQGLTGVKHCPKSNSYWQLY